MLLSSEMINISSLKNPCGEGQARVYALCAWIHLTYLAIASHSSVFSRASAALCVVGRVVCYGRQTSGAKSHARGAFS